VRNYQVEKHWLRWPRSPISLSFLQVMEHALQTWSQPLWIFHLQGYATEERLITILFKSFLPNSTPTTRFLLRHVIRSFGVWLRNWRNFKCWQRTSVREGGKKHQQKFVTQTTSSMDEQCRDCLSPLALNTDGPWPILPKRHQLYLPWP